MRFPIEIEMSRADFESQFQVDVDADVQSAVFVGGFGGLQLPLLVIKLTENPATDAELNYLKRLYNS